MIKPHTPTKACPHRWCRQMHGLLMAMGATILIIIVVRYPLMLLGVFLFVLMAVGISALVHKRTIVDEVTTGAVTDDLKPVVPLVVRPVWASIAVAMDIFYAFNASAVIYGYLTKPSQFHGAAGLTWYLEPVGLGISLAGVWFVTFAHRKATEPAAPKLVTVPEGA